MVISDKMVDALLLLEERGSLAESNVTDAEGGTVYHQTAASLVRGGLAARCGSDNLMRPVFAITNDGLTVLAVVRRMLRAR